MFQSPKLNCINTIRLGQDLTYEVIVGYQNRLYMAYMLKCESLNGVFVYYPTHCSVSKLNQTLVSTAAL